MGNLLAITVHAANIHDTKSGTGPARKACQKYPTLVRFCGDDGYRKSFENAVFVELGLGVDVSKRIKPEFEVLPMRWKVERTFGWANHSRRLSKDFEIKIAYAENMFIISHLHTLLKRYWIQALRSFTRFTRYFYFIRLMNESLQVGNFCYDYVPYFLLSSLLASSY